MAKDHGDVFQEKSKYVRGKLEGGAPDWWTRPEAYKTYPGAGRMELPGPATRSGPPIWEAMAARRSVREYADEPLDEKDFSQILWACQGITGRAGDRELRAAPSAGALYPIETYVFAERVEGVPAGLYHYDVRAHAIESLAAGDFRAEIVSAALDQEFLGRAAAVFVWTAVFERTKWKYSRRAYRYMYMDAAHAAANLAAAAAALGLGSCQVGAFYDDEVNKLLGVDGRGEGALYMSAVGKPRG